ncbi:nuclear RNA export factor 2-like isoform X2 [Cydia strobilella]|uniref:nuclear RNA export factor 2-like isoform X2 n=1 Tax=Cydia strobilella TaxID=1100964 RepID=UPI0030041CB4
MFPFKKTRRGGQNKKKNTVQNMHVFDNYKHGGSTSQFQAPHQDEPEDLSDDLAPHMGQGQQQPGTQTLPVTVENKLNFKFQRTTQTKTQDWSEYQNKFKRIGGASPDHDEEGSQEVKQELNKDQSFNTGLNTNLRTQIPSISQQTFTATQQKPAVATKVELKTTRKSTEIPLKPIDVRVRNANAGYTVPQPAPNMHSNIHLSKLSYETYPKGIPKSFLPQENNPVAPHPIPGCSFPAGIPRSFLIQEQQRLQEMPQPIPLQIPADPNYQRQPAFMDLPSWILPSQPPEPPQQIHEHLSPNVGPPMLPFVQQERVERPYSPTDVYSEIQMADDEPREGSESPDLLQSNQKRQSAFSRLGPLTQPKKPKLTINLQLNKDQAVREVVNETDESFRYVPVHLRKDILESEDEIVKKYLPFWPWKKNFQLRKTVSARISKSVMILEQEQMEAGYERDNVFIQVVVTGYPKTWTKEDVLDAVLDCVKGKSFIPLFTEFTSQKCRFLVIRCQSALVAIHKVGFCIRKDDVELTLSISLTDTGLNQIDLIPRLVLRRRLMIMSDENNVDLTEFLIEKDVSHFVYFPLNRATNQMELIQLQSAVTWEHLTELNLSRNRLTSIDGFDLHKNTPRLKRLDISQNYLDKVTLLLPIRGLPLRSLRLEGNPLCRDYIDPGHYIKVVRMMFHEVMELDGVRITLKGDLPSMKRNYCPEAAAAVVEKFLETFFPLLEAADDDRAAIEDLYDKDAVLTITFRYKLRYGTAFRYFRNLFLRARSLEEGEKDSVVGAGSITSLICKWPDIEHDRYTISVDVIHHDDFTTILRLGGVLKLTAKSLAEDEHLLTFTRTVVLHSKNGAEYKITNEMLYWDVPREEVTKTAFNVTTVRPKQLSLKLESPPDEELKSKLTDIFVKLADIDKKRGARCLELKNWDLRSALDYYIMLLKVDDLAPLSSPKDCTPAPQAS